VRTIKVRSRSGWRWRATIDYSAGEWGTCFFAAAAGSTQNGHSRQVYPVFEFKDADGMPHRVVNTTQQAIARFSRGDSVPIAYSRIDPERARIDTPWFSHRWVIGGIIVGVAIVIRALAGANLKQN
jgi:hypothetical protein